MCDGVHCGSPSEDHFEIGAGRRTERTRDDVDHGENAGSGSDREGKERRCDRLRVPLSLAPAPGLFLVSAFHGQRVGCGGSCSGGISAGVPQDFYLPGRRKVRFMAAPGCCKPGTDAFSPATSTRSISEYSRNAEGASNAVEVARSIFDQFVPG